MRNRRLLFAGALLLEACVIAVLWLVGRYFAN
jgi:hypothetical protein